jgi:hypothetical protein
LLEVIEEQLQWFGHAREWAEKILRTLELKFGENYQKTQNRIVQLGTGIYQEDCKLSASNQKGKIVRRQKKLKTFHPSIYI